jgi:hypothetical protein
MQTKEVEHIDRDRELENIVGNLMIAQRQVNRLRLKLTGRIGGYYHLHNIKTSAFTFKHNENWYKISIRVDEISNDEKQFFIKQRYEDNDYND